VVEIHVDRLSDNLTFVNRPFPPCDVLPLQRTKFSNPLDRHKRRIDGAVCMSDAAITDYTYPDLEIEQSILSAAGLELRNECEVLEGHTLRAHLNWSLEFDGALLGRENAVAFIT
jgi:hypothetical protein